jgi:hypothetical protein
MYHTSLLLCSFSYKSKETTINMLRHINSAWGNKLADTKSPLATSEISSMHTNCVIHEIGSWKTVTTRNESKEELCCPFFFNLILLSSGSYFLILYDMHMQEESACFRKFSYRVFGLWMHKEFLKSKFDSNLRYRENQREPTRGCQLDTW